MSGGSARRHRLRVELVPARRLHLHRHVVEAHGRDPRGRARRRGPGRDRRAAAGADGARAGDARALRALLPRDRDRRRSARWPRRRSATRPTRRSSSSAARERSGLEVEVLPGRGGGALRLPRGGQLDDAVATASCSTSAAARCSSRASTDREAADARSWPLGAVRMTERFLPDGGKAKRKQIKALREHVAARARARAVARRGRAADRRSAARCATSPRPRSSPPGCRPTASRASAITRDALGELIERVRRA